MATSAISTRHRPINVHEIFLTFSTSFLSLSLSLSHTHTHTHTHSLTLSLILSHILFTFAGSSPVMLSGLSHGKHVLKVVPTGCGRNRMNLKTTFTIE